MTKLRFDNLTLGTFNTFNFAKKKIVKSNTNKKLTTKLVQGVCIMDGEDFKIQVDVKALKPNIIEKGYPDILMLDFTENSYELKDIVSVFDRIPNKKGKQVRYIRSLSDAKFMPGSQDRYVPFCNNWICSGYIVRHNGKMMFDFNECIKPKGYDTIDNDL